MLGYFAYKIGEFIATVFPLRVVYVFCACIANLQFSFSKKDRNAVINNLRVILPNDSDQEIRKKAKEVFLNFGLYLVEFFRYKSITEEFVRTHVSRVGWEHVDNSLKKGKGAILLTIHLGNWELGGMAFGLLGYPIVAIALDHDHKKINDFFRVRRESKGVENISLGMSIKHCFKALKQNKLVAILGDRDFSNSGHRMSFLGREKMIPRGPAVLALHSGSPIVPVFVTRQTNGNLTVECLPPMNFSNKQSEIEIIQQYKSIMEDHIKKYPTQWLMFREFWKE